MSEVKLMMPLFDEGMYNRAGRRMRAVFIKEVSDGTTTYRLWRKDGKPEVSYPRCDNDRYILHVEVNGYLIPLRMTEFQMIDNCGYLPAGGKTGTASVRTSRSDMGSKPRRYDTTTGTKRPRTATPSIRILGRDKDV